MRVVLDPGHAYPSANRGGNGYDESLGMWKLCNYLKDILVEQGYDVALTKSTKEENPSLTARGAFAKNSDLFISEHSNAANGSARGAEVYRSVQLPNDQQLAADMSKAISSLMGNTNRGAKTRQSTKSATSDYYSVMASARRQNCPHVLLIESGFHDNVEDEAFLLVDDNLKKIAEAQANVIMKYIPNYVGNTTKPTPITTQNNEQIIWDFLKSKNFSDFAISGIMGNIFAESGLKPNNLQNNFEKTLGMTDDQYTQAVDNGSYANFATDSCGYGIVQWTYSSRKLTLLNYAKSQNKSIGDLNMQLNFMYNELLTYKGLVDMLNKSQSVLEASNLFLLNYEKPADQSPKVQQLRASYGESYYNKYHVVNTTDSNQIVFDAIDTIVQVNVLNSGDYWKNVIKEGKLQYLDQLFLNFSNYVKTHN